MQTKKTTVEPSRPSDITELVNGASEEDRADMLRGWGMVMAEACELSFARSAPDERFTIRLDGRVIGMFGCSPDGDVWLMRTAELDAVAIRFIRRSGPYIDRMVARHGRIRVWANMGHRRLIRWLAWAGFEVRDLGNGYFEAAKGAA